MARNDIEPKIAKIVDLQLDTLNGLIQNLLQRKGFQDVRVLEDCITGEQPALLNTTQSVFITFPFKLGSKGVLDYPVLGGKIVTLRDKYSANNVFVYSKEVITKGFQRGLSQACNSISITYLGRDEIISLVDEVFPEYWRHNDIKLLNYEKDYMEFVANDTDLKKLKFPNDKYSKLLDIFIEPQLNRYYQDKKTNTPVSKKYSLQELIDHDESLVIDGEAGSGKSTLLKRIGEKLIEENTSDITRKHYPIYLTAINIYDAGYSVGNAIRNKLVKYTDAPLSEIAECYDVHLLIDSIDEFEEQSDAIIQELNEISSRCKVKYYIGSRNGDSLISKTTSTLSTFSIRKFNLSQIKLFLDAFFSGDEGKSGTLLDALRNNQMIDRLPMTPLTLSLISILFEETDFEIPATISDLYDNFNSLIVGKAIVSSKIEFIDISFKERILSIYALNLLETPNHIPLKKGDYINFFKEYFEGKSLPIKKGTLEEVLEYLIQNTGILYLKDGDRVAFTHDSYMEYYAALEIFKHKREYQSKLIDNFFDPNWQNASIFYAGESKDMPDFLGSIIKKLRGSSNVSDYMSGIFGVGYLLQALYQTDNALRKEALIEALNLSLKNLKLFEMMAADECQLFKDYKMPILTLINFIYFYESFNSITLAEPLRMAFVEKYIEYESTGKQNVAIGYNLLELAFTLDSKRIMDQSALQKVIDTPEMLKDPNLCLLASLSLDLLGKEKYKEFINDVKKRLSGLKDIQKTLIEQPVSKLRFSAVDTIKCPSKVTLLVEGKTDAILLEYAYLILSDGSMPYWNIAKAGQNEEKGSCVEVKKTLEQAYALWKTDESSFIIGIFDHDNAGLGAYRGLCKDFEEISKDSLKKHKDGNIYAICIPVPGEMDQYLQPKQEFNFFEIEHYFGHEYLSSAGMLKESGLPNIFEITDKKSNFAKTVRKELKPEIFEHFLLLLRQIDSITNTSVHYVLP